MTDPAVFPISDTVFKVTPGVHGLIGEFGAAGGDSVETALWMFDIVPESSFVGEINLMTRFGVGTLSSQTATAVQPAAGASSPPAMAGPIPYRAFYLNAARVTLVSDQYPMLLTPITGRSMIQVASNGFSIGMLFACSAGVAWVYARPVSGSAAT